MATRETTTTADLGTPRAPVDPQELACAWHLLRSAAERWDRIAAEEGWPNPFGPARYLILAQLEGATAYGFSARRLARALRTRPSTLAHHLDALERAGLIHRTPWTVHDRRKVAVRPTAAGRYAFRLLTAASVARDGPHPAPPAISSPAIASP